MRSGTATTRRVDRVGHVHRARKSAVAALDGRARAVRAAHWHVVVALQGLVRALDRYEDVAAEQELRLLLLRSAEEVARGLRPAVLLAPEPLGHDRSLTAFCAEAVLRALTGHASERDLRRVRELRGPGHTDRLMLAVLGHPPGGEPSSDEWELGP